MSFTISMLGASLVVFLVISSLGGDVAGVMLGDFASEDRVALLREELGLDRPLVVQYGDWIGGVLTGDLGTSFISGRAVGPDMIDRLKLTLPLAVAALCVSILGGVTLGLIAALRPDSWSGRLAGVVAQLGTSTPAFWVGLLLVVVFGVRLGWLPTGGYVPPSQSFLGALRSLVLPVAAIASTAAAVLSRYVYAAVTDVLGASYMTVARSFGLTQWEAVRRHGLRNAALPLLTVIGLQFGYMVGGTVVIESVFFLPGVGRLVVDAVGARDVVVVQSAVFVVTAFILILNLLTDVAYGLIDPRVREGAR